MVDAYIVVFALTIVMIVLAIACMYKLWIAEPTSRNEKQQENKNVDLKEMGVYSIEYAVIKQQHQNLDKFLEASDYLKDGDYDSYVRVQREAEMMAKKRRAR